MSAGGIQWRNLIAASAAVAVFSFSLGEMFPLLALVMDSWGTSSSLIGLNSAMAPLGILAAGLIIPRLAHRYGSRRVALAAAATTALIFIGYPLFPVLAAWFLLRFAQGMTVACLFALSEAWIVKFAVGEYRARIVGVYVTVVSASFGVGPLVIKAVGISGPAPFLVGAAVLVGAMIPISFVNEAMAREADAAEQHVSIFAFAPKAPLLLGTIAIHAVFDGAMLTFLSVYGVRFGMSQEAAALLITALALGNVFFQIPIGWIADHTSKPGAIGVCIIAVSGLLLVMPWAIGTAIIWPLVVVQGAASFGIYTVGLALLGDRFTGTDLVAGTAAFSSVWGLGALVGSVICGWSMDLLGPHGLPYSLAAMFAAYLAARLIAGGAMRL